MELSGLAELVRSTEAYERLLQRLKQGGDATALLLEGAKPALLAALAEDWPGPLVVVTSRLERARSLAEALPAYGGTATGALYFPEPDALPYERLTSDSATVAGRLRVLGLLAEAGVESRSERDRRARPLVVASARAALQITLEPEALRAATVRLRQGEQLSPQGLVSRALSLGYRLVPQVEVPGTVSRRGGIVDLFSPGSALPIRAEFLGNSVESLREFDLLTQRSLRLVEESRLGPSQEVVAPPAERDSLRVPIGSGLERLELSDCDPAVRSRLERELEALLRGYPEEGASYYAPLFHRASLFDYLPAGTLLVLDEPEEAQEELRVLGEQAESERAALEKAGELPPGFPQPYLAGEALEGIGEQHRPRLLLQAWGEESATAAVPFPFLSAPSYRGRLGEALGEVARDVREGSSVVLISQQAQRLAELLEERGLSVRLRESLTAIPLPGVTILRGSLEGGWRIGAGGATAIIVLTDLELFGFTKQRRRVRRAAPRPAEVALELRTGDYVVHIEHGIARFGGFVRMAWESVERDYLLLEYAEGDKIYVPTEQVDRVTRYVGAREGTPTLTRLSTQEWARLKERVRRSARLLAQELLSLYAAREVAQGIAFSPDGPWQEEMEGAFPYVETPDQLHAVTEVKADMEQPRPMDRLVCGDVGYGKTEVALRAAFKALSDGYQVAVLVPTTILAQQHYVTFSQRLSPFPVKIEVLSRFRSEAEQRAVLKALVEGGVDICIGTHRLLQRDVHFRNLGLVVVDEEQRFGVVHKEHLKRLRQEVDVLTLSATPIPRTLYMALTGVRDMSTIETPPEERLPIRTSVGAYEERQVREAILREMEREGQVFFVHNRVYNIELIASRLRELVPEASIAIAHGQMPEEQLERVMFEFSQGAFDVLVCTTIIESGLDLPNVNTLIINQADRLGLAQLYQLRGRVGRGVERAYAYLYYDRGKRLTEAARARLQTIFEAAELGAGFRIAQRDLEIRGAGNLLGPEQSGNIQAVGFDLYSRLLAEAVAQLRAELGPAQSGAPPPTVERQPTIDLPLTALLPEEYVPELTQRLALYHRLARATTPALAEELARELRDRFGEPPEVAANLLFLAMARAWAIQGQVQAIKQEEGQVVVRVLEGVTLPRSFLERRLGRTGQVRSNQVRLELRVLGRRWRDTLLETLRTLAEGPRLVPRS